MDDSASEIVISFVILKILSDAESVSLKENMPVSTGDSSWCFEDDISGIICKCGAHSRAHKECPLNSQNHYTPKASSVDSNKIDGCVKFKTSKVSKGQLNQVKEKIQPARSLPQ